MAELWQRGKVTLTWSPGHDLHGLEVVMRRRPLGAVLASWREDGDDDRRPWAELTGPEKAERVERDAAFLVGLIVSWNLADDDEQPVPVTVDGLLGECDDDMISDMRAAYVDATVRVAPPLPPNSDAGPAPELDAGVPEEWAAAMPAQEVLIDHPV